VSARRRITIHNHLNRYQYAVYLCHQRFIFYMALLLHLRYNIAHFRTYYLIYSLLRANPAKAGDAELRG
jgi:hypothetical protein